MGSLIGPTTGWTMGWLAAGFLALQPLLQRAMGAMLLVLLIGACGGLLAALVALGGARSPRWGGTGRPSWVAPGPCGGRARARRVPPPGRRPRTPEATG